MIEHMVKVRRHGVMEHAIRVNSKTINLMVKACFTFVMKTYM